MAKFRILIIGGYGNFGGHISRTLAQEPNMYLFIGGRSEAKAQKFIVKHGLEKNCETAQFDLKTDLDHTLESVKPDLVIHTTGPFQGQSYDVAQSCIDHGCHYLDIADGREYVSGITALDDQAKSAGVLICSGASTVPALTSALIDHFKPQFLRLERVEYAIATAHLTNRGLATVRAVLSYAGKPFTTLIDGEMRPIYGWLGLRFRKFWRLNKRALGNCDIPDLALFPTRYPELKTLRFRAGLELMPLHLVLSFMSKLVKWRLMPNLAILSKPMLKISYLFDRVGTDDSGFYMSLSGLDKKGAPLEVNFDLVARAGDGLTIPTVGMIVMAKKLAAGEVTDTGAVACMGLISLDEYLEPLRDFDIEWTPIEMT